jgi:uncharacterized membrane protein
MDEETVVLIVGLLAFGLGFLVRGELQRKRKRGKDEDEKKA